MLRDLLDAPVHRQVVVPCGDDHVHPGDQAVLIDLIVMHQRAARRFGNADAFERLGFAKARTFLSRMSGSFNSCSIRSMPYSISTSRA